MYLIQQATVLPKQSWKQNNRTKTLLKALRIEWSGHPKLSNGAVPDALLRFINDRTTKVFGSITVRTGELLRKATEEERNKPVTIHYLVRAHHEQLLRTEIEQWSVKCPDLAVSVNPARPKSMLFCIDKEAECFLWTASQGKQLLEETLPVSAEALRTACHAVRSTATTFLGIINADDVVVHDRYSRMEKDDDEASALQKRD